MMQPSQPPSFLRRRSTMLAISAVVVVAAGAFAGAQLKQDVQKRAEIQKRREEPTEEKLARLHNYRAGLVFQKQRLETKIAELSEKA
ncbi:hypothetical protein EX30DRAFT_144884 [Ascodesmis nigricans]|uniref:Uncharacterized protein n=1 Tax=Ascodesmis nigricans TaxID=341454 RepID=A0A4S2N1E0_9PEZI|nr:hypothetical protein EX30DRAFT_144884 [Ascodesmis nigricans]